MGFAALNPSYGLTLDPDSEVDLQAILARSIPVFSRLVAAMRQIDTGKEAAHSLDQTDALIKHAQKQASEAQSAALSAKPSR
jgi:hypothetical protein